MGLFEVILNNLPEVTGPKQKRLGFKEKIKWTLITLVLFFAMSFIPLFGLGPNQLQQFEYLSVILGASFGSIMTLGIGPLVTASIVLQLLNGSGILKFNLTSPEGKKRFTGLQKLLAIFFVVFESFIYVFMSGLAPPEGASAYFLLQLLLVFQIMLGGFLIMFMDEVVSKWGIGSGISLFIAANVSQNLFIRLFSPLGSPTNPNIATGAIPVLFSSLASGDALTALLQAVAIIMTVLVFAIVVYVQSMKVEIPLSFGRVRGHGIRWPLSFLYTSNIPVILVAALVANIQLWARLLDSRGLPLLGSFSGGNPVSGVVLWLRSQNIVGALLTNSLQWIDIAHAAVYFVFFIAGSVLFSWFWMQTSGMDARSQAKQIMGSGLQIPGFRKDERVLERILDRYIKPLTIMGGIAIGFLAAFADMTGALSSGTGILLTVMIVYRFYEEIARQHMTDMNPMMRKFMGG